MVVDLRETEPSTTVTVTLATGEAFTGIVVDKERDYADEYSKGRVSFAFEGDWWQRINDRVDSEVLTLSQDFKRRTGESLGVNLVGTEWVGGSSEVSTPRYTPLGEVTSVEVHDE